MYCEHYDEHLDCEECSRAENCKQFAKMRKVTVRAETLRNTEFCKAVRGKFKKTFGLDDLKTDQIMCELADSALNISLDDVRKNLKDMAAIEARKYIEGRAKTLLDSYFTAALQDELRTLDEDKNIVTTKISEILLNKAKDFFYNRSGSRGKSIDDSLDKLMHKVVDEKVSEALLELQAECIDKFNKDILKTMMAGMTKAIASDKRLVAVINQDAE